MLDLVHKAIDELFSFNVPPRNRDEAFAMMTTSHRFEEMHLPLKSITFITCFDEEFSRLRKGMKQGISNNPYYLA